MRRALLAIAGALAGCYSDRGLAIEVDVRVADKGTPTSVELFVGNRRCSSDNLGGITCDSGIQPPELQNQLAANGGLWFRDDPAPFTAEVHGHTASFRLQAGDADADVPLDLVVVVGKLGGQMIGTSTLTGLTVPRSDALVVSTQLTRADPITSGSTAGDEERVAVWGAAQSCLAIEHWAGGNVTRQFIVPENDPDCDGYELASECNPAAYKATVPPGGAARPNCATQLPTPSIELGSRGCTDGAGDSTASACVAIAPRVCMPDSFAGCDLRTTCAAAVTTETPRIHCTLPAVDRIFDLCVGQETDTVDLSGHLLAGCEQPPLIGSIQALGFNKDHTFSGTTIEVAFKSECELEIKWTKGAHQRGAASELGLLRLPGNRIDGRNREALLLPIELEFVDRCTPSDQLQCTLVEPGLPDLDGVWDCATQPQ